MKNLLIILGVLFSTAVFAQSSITEKKWMLSHYEVDSKKADLSEDDENTVLYLKKNNTYEFHSKGETKTGIWHFDEKNKKFIMRSDSDTKNVIEFNVIKSTATDFVLESKSDNKIVRAHLKS